MEKTIDYLEEVSLSLRRLSSLCVALSCAQSGALRPSCETVEDNYQILRDILEWKASEIDGVVSEYYKARAKKKASKL